VFILKKTGSDFFTHDFPTRQEWKGSLEEVTVLVEIQCYEKKRKKNFENFRMN
jgi:hypothetical protein